MKRALLLLAAVCFFIFSNAVTKGQQKIIIRGNMSFPPYEFINGNGEPDGLNVDLTRAVMKELNLPYEIKLDIWKDILPDLSKGHIDLVMGVLKSEDSSSKDFIYSDEHGYIKLNIIFRKDSPVYALKDLQNKKIIVLKNAISELRLIHQGFNKLIVVDNLIDGLILLSQGKADAALGPNILSQQIIYKSGLSNLDMIDTNWEPIQYCYAANNPILISKINAALQKLKKNGTYNQLAHKWLGSDKTSDFLKYTYYIIAFLAIIVLMMFIIARFYRKKFMKSDLLLKKENIKLKEFAEDINRLYTMYKTIFNTTTVGQSYYNSEGILTDINDVMMTFFNSNNKQSLLDNKLSIYDNPFLKKFGIIDEKKTITEFQGILQYDFREGNCPDYFAKLHIQKKLKYFLMRVTPIKKDDGTLQCVIITAVDQTEMVRHNEKLEAEKIKLDLALEAGGVSAWIYDPQTQVFSGLKGETIAGKGITLEENFSKLHPEDVEMQKTILNELLQGVKTKASSTSRYLNEDGTYHFYESHLITKKENGKTIILGTQKDITEKMLRKKELERYQATLEKEKERAEQADKLKSAFLANMSHEIRTPLNAIVGFSELLQTEEDPQQRAIFMNIVNDNNEQLLRLVNDILDLSKIESGFIELKPTTFDLSIMVQEVYQSLKQRYSESEVNFILEIPHKKCYVTLDKGRLFQLYTNFVTNAFKHTSKGYIRIGYKSDEQGIKIYVEDTGCGISKDKQSLLFGRFAKLDDFSSGTGLGLAICKAITEAEHGTIGAISEEGKGSLFWAWLPSKIKIE